jgi:hypothetical protein
MECGTNYAGINETFIHGSWGSSQGNYFFVARLIDHEEIWEYTNGSGCC